MSKYDEENDHEENDHEAGEAEQGIGRRGLLKGGAVAVAAGAGLLGAGGASMLPGADAVAAVGPPRKMIWVVHELGVWNLPLDVAFNDVAKLAGWEYQKVASQPAFTVEGNTKDITTAIAARPDVLIVTMAGDGLLPILKKAQAQVPYLAIHQSFNDTLVTEEMPTTSADSPARSPRFQVVPWRRVSRPRCFGEEELVESLGSVIPYRATNSLASGSRQ